MGKVCPDRRGAHGSTIASRPLSAKGLSGKFPPWPACRNLTEKPERHRTIPTFRFLEKPPTERRSKIIFKNSPVGSKLLHN
jgi:hypothetical protein